MHFRIAYILHSLLYEELMQFVQPYNHPKEPFLKHQLDMHERIACNQYNYRIFLLNVTYMFVLFISPPISHAEGGPPNPTFGRA